jgi:hypothetical protein
MWEWTEERHHLSDEHGYAADDEAVNEPRAQELPSPEGEASGGAPLCLRLQRGCGVRGWGRDGLGTGARGRGAGARRALMLPSLSTTSPDARFVPSAVTLLARGWEPP